MKAWYFAFLVTMCFAVTGCSDNNAVPDVKNQLPKPDIPNANATAIRYQPNPSTPAPVSQQEKVILDIPIIRQNPELKYGCEVTSLAMVLTHAGIKTDKMELARELPKDGDPVQKNESGDITRWGNPNHGFVGDITGKNAGYAVYAKPLEKLMNRYLPNRTVNLTRKPFDQVLSQLQKEKPVIVWTTGDYKLPDRWESWKHGKEKITTPLDLHAVVLVGFDHEHLYINDPLTGKKAFKTNKNSFLQSWKALGYQALSYN